VQGKPTAYQEMAQQFVKHPLETIETGIGNAAAFGAVDVVAPAVLKPFKGPMTKAIESTRKGAQSLIGAGENLVAKAVEKVAAERHADVQQHFADVQKAKGEPKPSLETGRDLTPDEQVSRRQAIERGVERADPEIKAGLEKTEDEVNAEANRQFNELNAQLGMMEADPEVFGADVSEAVEKIVGTETLPTILKGMNDRLEAMRKGTRTDVPTYEDLQGYRSEIGRELRKGTLPGDVFNAYKGLQEAITKQMEDIAKREDEARVAEGGKALPKDQTFRGKLQAARAYYRQYAETFIDRDSPVRKALDATERGQTVKAFQGMDQTGIEALARYNPELAKRINTLRGLQEEAASLPNEKPAKYTPPSELAPKPEVNTRVLRQQLVDKWATSESSLNKWQVARLIGSGGIGTLIGSIFGGELGVEAGSVVGAASYALTPALVARLLENAGVKEWITRPPADELETLKKIPYADRIKITDGLNKVVTAAQKQGIKVDPKLAALVGAATTPKLAKTRQLEQTREHQLATQ
jgi:hypothetical protein